MPEILNECLGIKKKIMLKKLKKNPKSQMNLCTSSKKTLGYGKKKLNKDKYKVET